MFTIYNVMGVMDTHTPNQGHNKKYIIPIDNFYDYTHVKPLPSSQRLKTGMKKASNVDIGFQKQIWAW